MRGFEDGREVEYPTPALKERHTSAKGFIPSPPESPSSPQVPKGGICQRLVFVDVHKATRNFKLETRN
jgi:hypothetical protein